MFIVYAYCHIAVDIKKLVYNLQSQASYLHMKLLIRRFTEIIRSLI